LQGYKNILFSFQLAGLVVFNKDPTVWLDGARIPQKYICKYKKNNFVTKWYIIDHDSSKSLFGSGNCSKQSILMKYNKDLSDGLA
jgi:hypothetical protein